MEENPPVAVFKLGEKDHMAQLLNEGHVFMRPLLDFKTAEDSLPRLDPNEGLGYSVAAEGATLSMKHEGEWLCLLYTSDAADERSSVDLGGRRIIKKKTKE